MPVDRPPQPPASALTPDIRYAILRWIHQYVDGGSPRLAAVYLEHEVYGDPPGALAALERRYSLEPGSLTAEFELKIRVLAAKAMMDAGQFGFDAGARDLAQVLPAVPEPARAAEFLYRLPEAEFLTALELFAAKRPLVHTHAQENSVWAYLERVFRARGLPYTAAAKTGIEWVGDREIREAAIEPALTSLSDPRLSTARSEFEKARLHLRRAELKDAGRAAGDAVETTMAVLLAAHGHAQPKTPHGTDLVQANKLFDQLKSRAVALLNEDRDKDLIFAPMKVRNACGHGSGANPVNLDPAYVTAGVVSAAVAVTYLASKLP